MTIEELTVSDLAWLFHQPFGSGGTIGIYLNLIPWIDWHPRLERALKEND